MQEVQTDERGSTEIRNLSNSGSDSRENGIYGFNSSVAVGDTNTEGSNSNTESGTIAISHDGDLTTTNTGTDTTVNSGTLTTANTGTDTTVNSGTLTTANTGTDTTVNSGTLTTENTGTDTTVNSGTLTTTNTGTDTTVHSGNITTTNTGTDTTTHSGTLTTANTGTQSSSGSISNSELGDNDKTGERTREYTKAGNIGNISTQKLLNEEIDLWRYNFILEIMRDVANFVSLPIYEQ